MVYNDTICISFVTGGKVQSCPATLSAGWGGWALVALALLSLMGAVLSPPGVGVSAVGSHVAALLGWGGKCGDAQSTVSLG